MKQLKERHAIEKYVRRKNKVYVIWRTRFDYPELDNICTECMVRYGKLPRWEEYVAARRRADWFTAQSCESDHRDWRREIRAWCLERGVTTFANQSAQFLKFYYAWHRWQYEQRHGVITRNYARQMA